MDSILDEIAGHGIAFIDLCAEMREIVKSKWRRTDSPPQNLLRCLISSEYLMYSSQIIIVR